MLQSGCEDTNLIKNWLGGQAQSIMVNVLCHTLSGGNKWGAAGSILAPVLLNNSVNDLKKGMEGTCIKSADDTKLGGPVGSTGLMRYT